LSEEITKEEYLESILMEIKDVSTMMKFLVSSLNASLERNKQLEKRIAVLERKQKLKEDEEP